MRDRCFNKYITVIMLLTLPVCYNEIVKMIRLMNHDGICFSITLTPQNNLTHFFLIICYNVYFYKSNIFLIFKIILACITITIIFYKIK